MKFLRVDIILILMLLTSSPWRAFGDEPRSVRREDRSSRSQNRVTQVSNEEVDADAPPVEVNHASSENNLALDPSEQIQLSDRRWTLDELEAIADSLHPLLQRDRARVESSRGDALQAGLYPNPHFDTNNPQVFAGQNSLFNAGIMQEFVVKGKLRLDKAAATRVVEQNEFAFVQDRFQLLTMIRQQFYTVLAAERRLKVLRKLEEITASSLAAGRVLQKKAGDLLAPIDVLLLEIDNNRIQSDLEKTLRLLRGARRQLAAMVGDPSIANDVYIGNIYHSPPQFDEQILNQFATSSSAYVQIARLDIDRNEFLLKRAIAEPYPNVTLGPAYQWGLVQGGQQFWMTVTFPIPAWNRNQGNIISSQADVIAARKNLEAIQLEQLRKVADAFARHRSSRIQASKYEKEIIPKTMKSMGLARNGLAAGEYDFSRFLQVQRTVVEANMAYIDILEDVWSTAAELSGLLQLEEFQ
jgi:cobalt-zinc-cadmium efflux system outer membrane protein